jgi:NAD(P)-dependent dehydrogenase (short-subunit alcohol dehydrogenase family)
LNLLHALLASNLTHAPRLWLATRDAVAAPGSQVSGASLAPLRGLGLAIALEHPEFRCACVDLPMQLAEADLRALCDELENQSDENRLAMRAGHRYVARLARANPALTAAPLRIRDDGLYLITGGFGPLGLLFAQWLASQGARHIALVGRNATRSDASPIVEQLRQAGVTLTAAAADVSREEELDALFVRLKDSHPPLAGVMHCAGILDDGVLLEQSWTRFAPVFAPKVAGAWNLHAATREMPLDFFVLFSSTAAMLGHAGQANHGAANAFLDALAHARRAMGLPALSVNWGSWSRIGAAASERILDQLARQGVRPITPEQGVAALERVLSSGLAQAVVADIDVATAAQSRARMMLLKDLQLANEEHRVQPATPFHEQLDEAVRESRLALLTEHVRDEIARLAGITDIARIDDEAGFFELGMDSLTSVELRNRLQRSLGKTLPATLAFDYPNIRAFIAYLRDHVFGSEYFDEQRADSSASELNATIGPEESLDESIERELAELNSLLGTSR